MPNSQMPPALAALAARYAEILADLAAGRVSNEGAMAALAALRAYDDAGLCWTINPADGQWAQVPDGDQRGPDPYQALLARAPEYSIFGDAQPVDNNPGPGYQGSRTLEGATGKGQSPSLVRSALGALSALRPRTRNIALVIVAVLVALVAYSCSSTPAQPGPAAKAAPTAAPAKASPTEYCAPLRVVFGPPEPAFVAALGKLTSGNYTAKDKAVVAAFGARLRSVAVVASRGGKSDVAAYLNQMAPLFERMTALSPDQALAMTASIDKLGPKVDPVIKKDCGVDVGKKL